MTPLDNPPESPCFGCGPRHPRGLRLAFERRALPDREEVACTYTPKPDEIGWPGLLHTGLHFTVLFETSYWTALTLGGRIHTATGPQVFDQARLPRVGAPFTARARLVAGEGPLRVRATSETAEGKPCATLETTWRPASRAAVEKAGLRLPAYLLDEMEP
jgi:hypothetical protein